MVKSARGNVRPSCCWLPLTAGRKATPLAPQPSCGVFGGGEKKPRRGLRRSTVARGRCCGRWAGRGLPPLVVRRKPRSAGADREQNGHAHHHQQRPEQPLLPPWGPPRRATVRIGRVLMKDRGQGSPPKLGSQGMGGTHKPWCTAGLVNRQDCGRSLSVGAGASPWQADGLYS